MGYEYLIGNLNFEDFRRTKSLWKYSIPKVSQNRPINICLPKGLLRMKEYLLYFENI